MFGLGKKKSFSEDDVKSLIQQALDERENTEVPERENEVHEIENIDDDVPERDKEWYNEQERPYLRVVVGYMEDGNAAIDADFNEYLIHAIDEEYQASGVEYYDPLLEANAKVAIYLADLMNGIAEKYMPDKIQNDW